MGEGSSEKIKIGRLYEKPKSNDVLFVRKKPTRLLKMCKGGNSTLRNTKRKPMKLCDYQNRIQKVNKNTSHIKAQPFS